MGLAAQKLGNENILFSNAKGFHIYIAFLSFQYPNPLNELLILFE
jgi:hypothetical protein